MRMNRGTILLIAALLVVIVAVLVVNNNQNSNPVTTPTVAVVAGPILPGVTADSINHFEVRDNTSGNFTALTKDAGGAWHIDGTNTQRPNVPDQSLITTTAGQIVAINYNNTFQDDQLATFGLDKPAYTILAQTDDGKLYTLYIGSKAPTSSGYYATLVTGVGQSTPEATTESGAAPQANATENVASQQQNGEGSVPASTGSAVTATPYFLPSAAPATAEATAEATTAAAKKIFQTLAQATAEATAESTLDNVTSAQQNGSSVVTDNSAAQTSTPYFLPGSDANGTTQEATAASTMEPTANVIHNPAVTLGGKLTIYVIPQTVIDTLTQWIATPPYAPLPTPAPTNDTSALSTELPTPALEQGANLQVIPPGTPFGTQQVTSEAPAPTAEATAAATAGS